MREWRAVLYALAIYAFVWAAVALLEWHAPAYALGWGLATGILLLAAARAKPTRFVVHARRARALERRDLLRSAEVLAERDQLREECEQLRAERELRQARAVELVRRRRQWARRAPATPTEEGPRS